MEKFLEIYKIEFDKYIEELKRTAKDVREGKTRYETIIANTQDPIQKAKFERDRESNENNPYFTR